MMEVVSYVILTATIWFLVFHLDDWLITESGCSLAARAFSRRRASLRLKFICFTLERAGVPFRGMTHKSSLRSPSPSPSVLLLPSFPHSFEGTRDLSRRGSPRNHGDGSGTGARELSRTFREMAFRNSWSIKKRRGAKRYTRSWSFWRKRDVLFLFFFSFRHFSWNLQVICYLWTRDVNLGKSRINISLNDPLIYVYWNH